MSGLLLGLSDDLLGPLSGGLLGIYQDFVGLLRGLEHVLLVVLFDIHGFLTGSLGLGDLLIRRLTTLVQDGKNFVQEEFLDDEHLDKQVTDGGNQGERFHCHKGLIKCLH